jgi:hypothetical protein
MSKNARAVVITPLLPRRFRRCAWPAGESGGQPDGAAG